MSSGDPNKPFLSSTTSDDDDLDLEALSSKACALASVPVPDYADAIERSNKKSKQKYGDRFTIGDDEEDDEDDHDEEEDDGANDGIVLAERTSQILSNFQDYVSGIGGLENNKTSAAEEILEAGGSPSKTAGGGGGEGEAGGEETVTFVSDMASTIRSDNKTKLLETKKSNRRPSNNSVGSSHKLTREWNYNSSTSAALAMKDATAEQRNLHEVGSSIESWEDPEEAMMNLTRGQKYSHPLMQSRRIKLGVLNCVLVSAIVLGVTLGVSSYNNKSSQELGEKVDELENELAKVEGGGGGGGSGGSSGDEENTQMGPPPQGHEIIQPPGTFPKPPAGQQGNGAKEIIQLTVQETKLTQEQSYLYQNMVAKYQPRSYNRQEGWKGKTYLEAYDFCLSMPRDTSDEDNEGYTFDICPYEAICPLGGDHQPVGGYKDNKNAIALGAGYGPTWTPISDSPNDWAQLSHDNPCIKFSNEVAHAPEWGITGKEEDDEMTSHVMCCIAEAYLDGIEDNSILDQITHENAPNHNVHEGDPNLVVYQQVAAQYLPLEFDRSKGWMGQTYIEALQFCGSMNGYEICPLRAICPLGPDTTPLGGMKDDIEGSWMPIFDSANDWVQVGEKNSCLKYSSEHAKPPEWSMTGSGDEEITRHLMCCATGGRHHSGDGEFGFKGDIPIPAMVDDVDASDAAAEQAAKAQQAAKEQAMALKQEKEQAAGEAAAFAAAEASQKLKEQQYELAAKKYLPIEYDRAAGWDGSTYSEAHSFCSELQMEGGRKYSICPFEAICPLGPDNEPLGGYKLGVEQAWVPMSNTINDWVQLAESNSCITFSGENPTPPEWGITGDGSEDITTNLLCCVEDAETDAIEHMQSAYNEELIYKTVALKYQPIEFNREKEWKGQTYLEAIEFCGVHGERSLCPYEAICPMGTDGRPLGGFKEGGGSEQDGSWMPLMADEDNPGNQWVQISDLNHCVLYSNIHPSNPEWGITGEGSEEVTRNLFCCNFIDEDGESINPIGPPDSETEADEDEAAIAEQLYEAAINAAKIKEDEAEYIADETEFLPLMFNRIDGWRGQTYLEAIKYCASIADKENDWVSYQICPYEALCPEGPDKVPVVGMVPGVDGDPAWVPLANEGNDWVDLSPENPCVRYRAEHPGLPEWGRTGEDNEELTRNILCCKGSIYGEAQESYVYEAAAEKYHPIWRDRDSGWTGQTYVEAEEFCSKTNKRFGICPYDAICPFADMDEPLGGVKEGPKGAWVPMAGVSNGWVSVGPENTCQIYDIVHGEQALWGLTGEGNEDITRHVACCETGDEEAFPDVEEAPVTPKPTPLPTPMPTPPPHGQPTYTPTPPPTPPPTPLATPPPTPPLTLLPTPPPTPPPTPLPTPLPTILPTPVPTNKPTPSPTPLPSGKPTLPPISGTMGTAVEAYKIAESYSPMWYDRSSGWTGQTYDEAFEFCSNKGPNHDICPYDVICPAGPLNMPYAGSRNDPRTSWAPINHPFNSWVQVSDPQVCVKYQNLHPEDHPAWGLTGVDNEDLTRHVMCCDMENTDEDGAGGSSSEEEQTEAYEYVVDKYAPKWFDRSEGWDGNTYADAIEFCALKDSNIPCPYEAYCPMGVGSIPTGGYDGAEEAWAAIIDVPNGWVQIGSYEKDSITNSCMKYNNLHDTPPLWGLMENAADQDLTPHIMCCKEPPNHVLDFIDEMPKLQVAKTKYEQEILEGMHPIWFSRIHGYKGKTWQNAVDFCNAIGEMVLCPRSAYCSSDSEDKLFLQTDPFEGEQWAPAASEFNTRQEYWVSLGQNPSTCSTYEELFMTKPPWVQDGSQVSLKEHVLCCQNPKHLQKEQSLMKDLSPIWMDSSHGWNGGSHDDAIQFCEGFGNRKLCPYTAYCPHGPGQPVMGGQAADLNTEGEQWAAIFGEANHWVMIGQKYQNHATTCMDSTMLEGEMPDVPADKKKNIMCCSF